MGIFIRFEVFTSNHVCEYVCVSGLWRVGTFFHCGVMGFQPLEDPDGGTLFHFGLLVFQPLADTCYIIF